ncbi:MAG: DUF1501 domain-containing protein [Planctomycetota bacterium]|nr:DUF1501 domain-containing protein [Planctomycetota bacterium]MDA1213906.1 DUF1501 domain-containing protein [Planctomycetota bacterium]
MAFTPAGIPAHPQLSRRTALQIGSIGLLGLGMNHVQGLRALAGPDVKPAKARSVIYIFLSGGLAQHESFDLKPKAPAEIRGEFSPIDTQTPGIQICEHMPLLAARSNMWSLCRSLTHPYTGHSEGHHVMLTGRTMIPPGFNGSKPMPSDWPAIACVVNQAAHRTNNLPPAVVLPETLIHRSGRTIPGQFAGHMGDRWNPWFIEASAFNAVNYGAYPEYGFHFERGNENPEGWKFQAPSLTLPEGFSKSRLGDRLNLLNTVESQLHELEDHARIADFDRQRQMAVSLLADPKVRQAVDVTNADDAEQLRYGKNVFGWSCLMARNLVESGVSLVQVNLGNNESWDTHEMAFPLLKNNLLPPTDKAVSALLDDLSNRGLLDDTLIVMAGEFGRTPRVSVGGSTNSAGRNHWGPVQTVFFAGGGVRGGTVVGSSDDEGGYPASDAQTPENMAATIYNSLGLPDTIAIHDDVGRPHFVYHGSPIAALF